MVNTNIVKNSENGEADKIAADSISSAVADSSGLPVRDTSEKTQVITFDNLGDLDQVLIPESDSINDSVREGKWSNIVKNRLNKLKSKEGKEAFTQSFRKYVNLGMFFLMPLTALIFYLLFMKGTFYIQHLVFVLHLQSAMYILFTIFNIVELGVQSDWIDMALAILFFSLIYIWIKKFYETGWAKAIYKSLLFLFLYTFLFTIFMGMIGALSAWNL